MNRRLLWVAMVGAACGGSADFTGHWTGSLQDVAPCSDGSTINQAETDDWVATQSGSTVTLAGNGPCGVIYATANGDTATFQPKTCTAVVSGSYESQESITGGTVRLNGSTATVAAQVSIAFSGPTTGSCTGSASGTLTKN